jgi:hypothetical protein
MDILSIVVEPDERRSVSLGGTGTVFEVSRAGSFVVVEHTRSNQDGLVLPAVHQDEDEVFLRPPGDDRCEGQ